MRFLLSNRNLLLLVLAVFLFHFVVANMEATLPLLMALEMKAVPAARLFAAVDAERERTGLVVLPPEVPVREAAIEHGRAFLGDAWESEVERGRLMSLDEAVDYASRMLPAD